MAHSDARGGKWRGKWQMGWVASILTLPRNMVYPALLPLMRTPRLPAVDWTDAPADLNGLVRFSKRRNPVSAHVPSRFKRSLQQWRVTVLSLFMLCEKKNARSILFYFMPLSVTAGCSTLFCSLLSFILKILIWIWLYLCTVCTICHFMYFLK
jgi:hypothetical protein